MTEDSRVYVPLAVEARGWARQARIAIVKRDAAIRAMRAEGATLREIAETVGMTPPGVARVLKRSG